MEADEVLTGSFASSGGQSLTSIDEDCARDAIKAAALLECDQCEAVLLTGWQFCPDCGTAVMVAEIRE